MYILAPLTFSGKENLSGLQDTAFKNGLLATAEKLIVTMLDEMANGFEKQITDAISQFFPDANEVAAADDLEPQDNQPIPTGVLAAAESSKKKLDAMLRPA